MATERFFAGKRTIIPGVYSQIKSGIKNPPSTSDYGIVLVIDTGSQAEYGGGSGVNGEFNTGQDSIYEFTDLATYREFLKGSVLWKCADALFKPDGAAIGASKVYHVKAATTTKSTMTFTATGGGSAGGSLSISPKDEGIIGNGLLDGTNLYKGYAYTIETGVIDTSKWIFKLWRGTFTKLHTDGLAFDGIAKADSTPLLITQSPEFDNMQTLEDWLDTDANFGEYFVKNSSTVTGAGTVDSADVSGKSSYQVASGGTESYGSQDLTDTLEAVKDLDYTHILADKYGTTSGTVQVETITFPATSAATQGDYILLYNHTGETAAVWLDIDGAGTAPTGTNYINSNYKVEVDIATGDTATQVASKAYTAIFNTTNWRVNVTLVNNGDGTLEITQGKAGDVDDAVPKDASDATAGSITATTDADGADGTTTYNGATIGAIVSHIETDAKYDKYMFFGGGKDKTEFTQTGGSIPMAQYFDTNRVLVVHGESKESSNLTASGFRQWPTIYKAAKVCGRTAGLEPQTPITFKSIGIDGEAHKLTDKEKIQALEEGVLVTYYDSEFEKFTILQGINSLQKNTNFINPDGKSFSHQIERIKAQLNKDLLINAKIQLLGQPSGVNRNTLSPAIVKNWTESFLESKKATEAQDNIIISYQDVTVTRVSDYYNVTYGFVPNGEITKLYFTGFMLD